MLFMKFMFLMIGIGALACAVAMVTYDIYLAFELNRLLQRREPSNEPTAAGGGGCTARGRAASPRLTSPAPGDPVANGRKACRDRRDFVAREIEYRCDTRWRCWRSNQPDLGRPPRNALRRHALHLPSARSRGALRYPRKSVFERRYRKLARKTGSSYG